MADQRAGFDEREDPFPSTLAASSELDLEEERIEVPAIDSAFEPGGSIARVLKRRYHYREGQVHMARLVRQALNEGKSALIEAGTGCGKSFAYLIPVIWSGARAFVSTANKTLQTQLWEKDIPALRQVTPRPFEAALLKGRSNYVCRLKLRTANQQPELPGLESGIFELHTRLRSTPSGDVEDLRLHWQLRELVTAGTHDCLGRNCPFVANCYYEIAKVRAERAQIVVINHALLAFNLLQPFMSTRPIVVVDEAHELETYTVSALRMRLDYETVPSLINDTAVMRHVPDKLRGQTVDINNQLFKILAQKPSEKDRRWAVAGKLEHGLELAQRLNTLHGHLLRAYPPEVDGDVDEDEKSAQVAHHEAIMEWALELAQQVNVVSQEPTSEGVRYCEEQSSKSGLEALSLYQEPLDVSGFLNEALFRSTGRVIGVGATLSVANHFTYLRHQIGAPEDDTIEAMIDSPFDYSTQALLYTPNGLEPCYGAGEENYVLELGREIWRLLQASRGRAFVLCTSKRRMNQLYELISPHLEYNTYCQGSGLSRAELIDLFQNDAAGAVLFATRSFWEGVDIPGEALSMVIIDKLPFAPHYDPVIQHRQQLIRDRGGDPFNEMTLPEAILALKQGVGRLIRTETDRGVMAVLDSRINTRRYGQQIIASLPRARRTRRIQDVRAFFEQ
jgi:Rad3-related DNA helicase